MSPTVPSVCFRTGEIDIKHQRKIQVFSGGRGLFGLILAAPLPTVNYKYEYALKISAFIDSKHQMKTWLLLNIS